MSDYVQVWTAVHSRDAAVKLAQDGVAARLAASAQVVGPVATVFWHHGELGTGEEWQVILYTTIELYGAIESWLGEDHPWDNPQIMATPIVYGSPEYLAWISRATADGQQLP
ncbi:divalent-cation tolerance protein CutA [Micromonospora sp. NPDC092111]|uniref:divalent-cation tolerance protein CutA n=1 Tax=Micromonospora sp. NPDC092111 TaxID=3364289 RepID=UPI0037FEA22E